MQRREALQRVTLILGGTVLGANAFLAGCKSPEDQTGETFTDKDIAMLDEIAETIIPTTNTPGAKAAKVGAFMTVMVNDCYDAKDQKEFRKGMNSIRDLSDEQFKKSFMEISPEQRLELLKGLDKEQGDAAKKQKDDPKDNYQKHYFRMMKELTLLGYFTSEIGQTQALRYKPVPGKYEGCVPYTKGDKAWA